MEDGASLEHKNDHHGATTRKEKQSAAPLVAHLKELNSAQDRSNNSFTYLTRDARSLSHEFVNNQMTQGEMIRHENGKREKDEFTHSDHFVEEIQTLKVLKGELEKTHEIIAQQDREMYDLKERLHDAEDNIYRVQADRLNFEAKYVARLEELERKELEDAHVRRLMESKVRESELTEQRLRQSILLLEGRFSQSMQSLSSGGSQPSRRRSFTISGGEMPTHLSEGSFKPRIPPLLFRDEGTTEFPEEYYGPADSDGETAHWGDEDENALHYDEYEDELVGEEHDEDDAEAITVSLEDVLGMVKYKGERTIELQERIHGLSFKIQELQHQQHVQQLQLQHEQQPAAEEHQQEQEEESIKLEEGGNGRMGWGFVFLVVAVGIVLGILLRNGENEYFTSLHPS